jgi:hypothetical protein
MQLAVLCIVVSVVNGENFSFPHRLSKPYTIYEKKKSNLITGGLHGSAHALGHSLDRCSDYRFRRGTG